jgi:hypothetical protein
VSVGANFAHTAEYLDYAEMQAVRNRAMYMKDWVEKLNAFLKFSEYEILTHSGKVSHAVAVALAGAKRIRIIQENTGQELYIRF